MAVDSKLSVICGGGDRNMRRLKARTGFNKRIARREIPAGAANIARPDLGIRDHAGVLITRCVFLNHHMIRSIGDAATGKYPNSFARLQ